MRKPAKEISIRAAQDSDITEIKELLRLAWHQAYAPTLGTGRVDELISVWHTEQRLKNDIAQPNINFLVAVGSDTTPWPEERATAPICATATVTRPLSARISPPKADLIIGRMYVHPAAQKGGLGTVMMQQIIKPLASGTRLALTVEPANQGAIRFYQRFGFEIYGPGSCSEDPHDDVPTLIMATTI